MIVLIDPIVSKYFEAIRAIGTREVIFGFHIIASIYLYLFVKSQRQSILIVRYCFLLAKNCVHKAWFPFDRPNRRSRSQCLAHQVANFPYKPILHCAYSLLKENNRAINRLPLGLYALFHRTHAKIRVYLGVRTCEVFLCFVTIVYS